MQKSLGDIRILNRRAWSSRWKCRVASVNAAQMALDQAKELDALAARSEIGAALRTLSWQAKWRGDFDEAQAFALSAEEHLPELQHPTLRAELYSILGVIHYSRNRLDLANCAVKRGFAICPDDPNALPTRIDLMTTKATVQRYAGHFARANVTLGAALELAQGVELARVEHNVARCVLADEKPEEAIEHAQRAVDLCKSFENRVVLPYACEVLGACLWRLGRFDEAEAQFSYGLEFAMRDNDRRAQCQIIQKHGLLELDRGKPEFALDLFKHGASIAERMTYGLWQKDLALNIAAAHEALGNFSEAVDAHKSAWKMASELRS